MKRLEGVWYDIGREARAMKGAFEFDEFGQRLIGELDIARGGGLLGADERAAIHHVTGENDFGFGVDGGIDNPLHRHIERMIGGEFEDNFLGGEPLDAAGNEAGEHVRRERPDKGGGRDAGTLGQDERVLPGLDGNLHQVL